MAGRGVDSGDSRVVSVDLGSPLPPGAIPPGVPQIWGFPDWCLRYIFVSSVLGLRCRYLTRGGCARSPVRGKWWWCEWTNVLSSRCLCACETWCVRERRTMRSGLTNFWCNTLGSALCIARGPCFGRVGGRLGSLHRLSARVPKPGLDLLRPPTRTAGQHFMGVLFSPATRRASTGRRWRCWRT